FFGSAYQKLSLQQDKVTQFLTAIGKMVRELFQLVRELRVMDERLELYRTSEEGVHTSEITLKGYWVELVEQGAKNPGSVYGMAREVQFTTLPDLFFNTFVRKSDDVDKVVDQLEFNRKVREVVKRKLKAYLIWKEHTFKEIKNRRKFTLKFLRQHYTIIRMYLAWIKPYLRHIKRLKLDEKKNLTPNLVDAFEGSMVEIELLAKKDVHHKCFACVNLHFLYRSRAEMISQGYQRNPIHVGRNVLTLRSYAWTQKELDQYKKFRIKEDFDLIASIDNSIKAALIALGSELERYLAEAEEEYLPEWDKKQKEKEKEKEAKSKSLLNPLNTLSKSLRSFTKGFTGEKFKKCSNCGTVNTFEANKCKTCSTVFEKRLSRKDKDMIEEAKHHAIEEADDLMYEMYDEYKEGKHMPHFG
ncbi:hypothetical protein ACFL0W_05855, partial [Nanoarchaeota archaeon]